MKHQNQLRWITETAVLLALLVTLQAITKPLGQLVTGSFVNAVLAVTVLFAGLSSGLTVAVISPVLAYLLGIAPQILTVPAIMAGNAVYVLMLHLLADRQGKNLLRQMLAWIVAAVAKFATLYAIVVWLICGLLSERLIAAGVMKAPMLKLLPATFSWPQLITALIGGAVASVIAPTLNKALKPGTTAKEHEGNYWFHYVVSVLIPLVGFIVGAIMLTKDETVKRACGKKCILLGIIGAGIAALILMLG